MKYKLSIITVTYNCQDTICETLESILKQDFKKMELLIIDGKSSDETLKIIKSYKNDFFKKNCLLNVRSEDDEGIADAFNKGIDAAQGEWIYFLNSGDIFYEENTLIEIFQGKENYDIITGRVEVVESGKRFPKNLEKAYNIGMIAHQGTFIKKQKLNDLKFNKKTKIRMDYEFFLKLLKKIEKKDVYFYNKKPISYYRADGISSINRKLYHIEGIKIANQLRVKYKYSILMKDIIKYLLRKINK